MVRFILSRQTYMGSNDDHDSWMETLDAECPELEKALKRGGFGGGPNGDDFDRTRLISAEIRAAHQSGPEGGEG